jgi:hypothetical protein
VTLLLSNWIFHPIIARIKPLQTVFWKDLPVRIYIKDEHLKEAVTLATELLNDAFNEEVYTIADRDNAELIISCVDKGDLAPLIGGGATIDVNASFIYSSKITIGCGGYRDVELSRNTIAHELYHSLGFWTPGLGHSYNEHCISYPLIGKAGYVCKEMIEDFNQRYHVIRPRILNSNLTSSDYYNTEQLHKWLLFDVSKYVDRR